MLLSLKQQLGILLLAAGMSLAVGHGVFDQKWSRGDEHHYLIGALSLVQDRDLDLTANYADRDGAVFGYTEAEAHARADRAGRLHPSHPPGVIFALAGPYYLAGARGAYGAYALLFGWIFLETVKLLLFLGQPLGRSLWLTTAVMGSPLVMLNAARLFPALPAAACVTVTAARILRNRTLGPARAFGLGLLISYLPWLHPRLSLAALVGGIGLLVSQWRAKDKAAGRRAMAATILGALTSGALFFAYQAYLFDDPWMFTRIGGGEFGLPRIFSEFYTTYRNSWGPLGLLLDQEYGLIPYAPDPAGRPGRGLADVPGPGSGPVALVVPVPIRPVDRRFLHLVDRGLRPAGPVRPGRGPPGRPAPGPGRPASPPDGPEPGRPRLAPQPGLRLLAGRLGHRRLPRFGQAVPQRTGLGLSPPQPYPVLHPAQLLRLAGRRIVARRDRLVDRSAGSTALVEPVVPGCDRGGPGLPGLALAGSEPIL